MIVNTLNMCTGDAGPSQSLVLVIWVIAATKNMQGDIRSLNLLVYDLANMICIYSILKFE